MRIRFYSIMLAAVILSAVHPAFAADEAKTFTRTEDPIVLTGGDLVEVMRWEIARTRAFAFRNGAAVAIPFQIDERKKNGDYVLPFGGSGGRDDEIAGGIDANDELIFMVRDAGDRGGKDRLPGGAGRVVEMTLTDPVTGGRGWVYFALYPGQAPALSPRDYVSYDNQTLTIDTERFIMRFHPKATLSIGDLIIKPEGGGSGRELVDRLKIRFTAQVMRFDLVRDEENFLCTTVGWIDGPVRVVRHTINQVQLWKLKSPQALTDNVYYFNAFEFPTVIELPFRADLVVSNPKFRISTDGLCNGTRTFYNSRNPQGVTIDGRMSQAEYDLDIRPYIWSAITDLNGKAAWLNRLIYDEKATPVQPYLYYNDDAAVSDAPEDEAGECGDVGYTLENLGQLAKEKMYLKSILYCVPDYRPGREREYLNILDRTVKVSSETLF